MTITKYTPEQHEILDHTSTEDGILLVAAGPGTGKSFMSDRVARALKPNRGLYTAFNKAIVEEGVARFKGTNVECKTLHALAYKYVQPKKKIEDISYSCIEEKIPYGSKYKIISTINDFFVSNSVDMYDFMERNFDNTAKERKLNELSIKYIEQMIEGKLSPTFNFLLKYFHLMLVEGTVNVSYDLVILDEINDTTAVALEIFKLIKAPKKLGLGDPNQAIYDFLNLVDGFEELEDVPILSLTQSFRCSTQIGADIQSFMRKEVDEDLVFIGTDEPVANGRTLYCTRTNAKIIEEISDKLNKGSGFHLLRKVSEIFAYPMAIVTAATGKKVYQKKFKFLEDEYKSYEETRKRGGSFMQHLLEFVDDQETKSAVNLLLSLKRKNINLFNLYNDAKNAPVDMDYTIATVFTSKGLEYENVFIADDLNAAIQKIRDNGGIDTHEDLVAYRCYYVACSRAGVNLMNATALKD